MIGVVLMFQVCMASPQGGVLLQRCVTRTLDAPDCATALGLVEATLAPDRVAVAGGCVTIIPPSRPLNAASLAYEQLVNRRRRADRRRRLVQELAGPLPPHLATMHSNAAWFRVQRAATFLLEQEEKEQDAWKRLKASVLGEVGNG